MKLVHLCKFVCPVSPSRLLRIGCGLVGALWAVAATGKTEDPKLGVPLTMRMTSGTFGNGHFVAPPNASDDVWSTWRDIPPFPYAPGSYVGFADYSDFSNSALGRIGPLAQVGKAYALVISSHDSSGAPLDGVLSTSPLPGYDVNLNGNRTNQSAYHGDWLFWVQVFPTQTQGGKVGEFLTSASVTMAVNWQMSLGSLHNGTPAGVITLADTGARADWTPLYTPAMLSYETASDEVCVYRINDTPRQIIANEVAVDIVTLSSTSYELRCYSPDQITSSTYPVTFSGSPFVTYRIAQGSTATSLVVTREYRNVTDLTSTFPVARADDMTVARSVTGAGSNNFTWTRTAWTTQGSPSLAATTTSSADAGTGSRAEHIYVSNDGTQNNAAFSLTRTYSLLGGDAEMEVVTSESVGSVNPHTTAFTYPTDTSGDAPTFSRLSSVALPGGGWIAYDYMPATPSTTTARGGQVHYEYRPYGNAPVTVTRDTSQGLVTHYEYAANEWGEPIWPALIETQVNGTLVSKSTFTYAFEQGYPNGCAVTRTTRTDYVDATHTLTSTACTYTHEWGASLIRGQIYSQTQPDGSRTAYAYELGTWDGNAFTPGSGTGSRVTRVTGTSNSSVGTLVQNWNSQSIEPHLCH